MKDLGLFLKENRERQKLSQEDIASRTKIHIQKIIDIENGNKEGLPAKVFCIGLIKSYAKELKLDMAKINIMCAMAFEKPQSISTTETQVNDTPVKKVSGKGNDEPQMVGRFKVPKVLMIAASGLLSLLLLFAILQIIEKMNSYSQEEALPKEIFTIDEGPSVDPFSDPDKIKDDLDDSIEVGDETKDPTKERDKPDPTLIAKQNFAQQTPQPKPEVANKGPADIKTSFNGEDFSEDNFGDSKKEKSNVVVSDNKLVVTALEPVRAEVVWADGYVQVMLLKSQETKTLVFSQPITLRVNNGGAIQVSFNDSAKFVPGTFNKPLEKTYP